MDKEKDKNPETESAISLGLSSKNQEIISFFDDNQEFVFVYKKSEKLMTAIYMVTNLFPGEEPMRWMLREKAGAIMSFMIDYKNIISSKHKNFSVEVKMRILEMVSLLKIASGSGLVSSMNFSILEQEFAGLIKTIDYHGTLNKELQTSDLSGSFFHVSSSELKVDQKNPGMSQSEKYKSSGYLSKYRENLIKDSEIISDKLPAKKTNRQDMILGLLRKKKDLNIKDISSVVKGCSEKTIQRELISLIMSGVVKKTGERRWSKYSLLQ